MAPPLSWDHGIPVEFLFQDNPDRAMIGTMNIWIDGRALYLVNEGVGDSEVIDTPSDITLPGLCPVRPPGIGFSGIRV